MLSAFLTLAMATSALAAPRKDLQRRQDKPASYLTFTAPDHMLGRPERVWNVSLENSVLPPDYDTYVLHGFYGDASPAYFQTDVALTGPNTKALAFMTAHADAGLWAFVPTLSPGEGAAQAANITTGRFGRLPLYPGDGQYQWDVQNGEVSFKKNSTNQQFLACEGGMFNDYYLAVGTASKDTGAFVKGCVATTVKQVLVKK